MAQFSGTVKISDLNDFIAPSQACVVSLQGKAPDAKPPAQLLEEEGKVQLHQRPGGNPGFKQTYTPGGKEEGPVKVSLHDCLACSGCVTSAETVLLQNQSVGELVAKLTEPGAMVVVSVSPQSRASLAALHGLDASDVQSRLTTALRRIGVAAVLDIGVAREMALAEAAEEFLARYHSSRTASTSGRAPSPTHAPAPKRHAGPPSPATSGSRPYAGPLPMLASACPGWVCYAEKTQAGNLLPHISTTKSPQAIMGTIVKRRLAALRGWEAGNVYHAAVMPCYDKKLEASRDDFMLPGTSIPEIDSCLTTGELQQLLEGWDMGDLGQVTPTALDLMMTQEQLNNTQPQLQAHPHGNEQQQQQQLERPDQANGTAATVTQASIEVSTSLSAAAAAAPGHWEAFFQALSTPEPPLHGATGSSGGYMEHVLRAAAARLLPPGAAPPSRAPLPVRIVRNSDFKEVIWEPPAGSGVAPLRFAAVYGFRNIQSLVRKVKLGRCEYDYVEVMACPGGCLNGGGQLKPRSGQSTAQLLEELEMLYYVQRDMSQQGKPAGSCYGGNGAGASTCTTTKAAAEVVEGGGQQQAAAAAAAATPAGASGQGCACSGGAGNGTATCAMEVDGDSALSAGGNGCASGQQQQQQGVLPWQPSLSASARALYRDWVGGGPGSAAALQLLHTSYHHREKTVMTTVGDW